VFGHGKLKLLCYICFNILVHVNNVEVISSQTTRTTTSHINSIEYQACNKQKDIFNIYISD